MLPPHSIRTLSMAEAIVQNLLVSIRAEAFGPGDRLPSEQVLQAELGVGRLALREGLARLSALGIIRVDHGKGAFVQAIIDQDPDQARQLARAHIGDSKSKLQAYVAAQRIAIGTLQQPGTGKTHEIEHATMQRLYSD